MHTGPVKRAGGHLRLGVHAQRRRALRPDKHADRPRVRHRRRVPARCAATANWYGGTIIDDVVPGHTGKGADFRLAEMKYADYPGIYHMVEIDPLDWEQLPEVPAGADSVNIDAATEEWLDKAGYIIGRLQRVIFYGRGRQGDELERHPPGRRDRRRASGAGCTCTTSRRVSRRSTGWTRRSPACGWSSVTPCIR